MGRILAYGPVGINAPNVPHPYLSLAKVNVPTQGTTSRTKGFDCSPATSSKPCAAISPTTRNGLCGTFAIRTNQMDLSARTLYGLYKMREDIEQLVDAYKVELGCATTGMHSDETLESCLFVNHLALAMAYRVYNRLKKQGMLKKYAVTQTLEQILSKVMVTNVGDGWTLEPAPKACRDALTAMGLSLPAVPE